MGSEPGVSRAESQSTEREGTFTIQDSIDNVLDVCTSPKQTTNILLQPDIGVDNEEKTTTSEQAAACEEFARPPKKR